jgi:predicted nucleotidyltransferase component of viral defense system
MIPRPNIAEWKEVAPWKEFFQIEQDLVISRVLVEIFSDDYLRKHLAFRGGTALHKLFISPPARYSEDIDLVQVKEGPIKPILERLQEVISFFPHARTTKVGGHGAKIFYKFLSEYESIPLKLKIEINCKEHFNVLEWNLIDFTVDNGWFNASCEIRSYQINELLGTKLRALYQRKKGRDLFDLYFVAQSGEIDLPQVFDCYRVYMKKNKLAVPSKSEFLNNLADKAADPYFLSDMETLLGPEISYDVNEAARWIMKEIDKHY